MITVESFSVEHAFSHPPSRVLIVDPDDLARAGLCGLLSQDARFAAVGDAAIVATDVARLKPDLIVVDPVGGDAAKGNTLAALRHAAPAAKLVILTSAPNPQLLEVACEQRVHGYFGKAFGAQGRDLLNALALIAGSGAVVVGPLFAESIWSRCQTPVSSVSARSTPLTERQAEVLQSMALNDSDGAIGKPLNITAQTVEYHVATSRRGWGSAPASNSASWRPNVASFSRPRLLTGATGISTVGL